MTLYPGETEASTERGDSKTFVRTLIIWRQQALINSWCQVSLFWLPQALAAEHTRARRSQSKVTSFSCQPRVT